MNRRGFLSSCLALAAAPAIVRADNLMRIVPRSAPVIATFGVDLSVGSSFTIAGVYSADLDGEYQIFHVIERSEHGLLSIAPFPAKPKGLISFGVEQ